jgi:hypothetical protein
MKRTFAALTAITIAVGLSLAAVVPASATDTPTPTSTPVASSTPTAAPTASPPAAPTAATTTAAPTATAAATSTPTAAPEAFVAAAAQASTPTCILDSKVSYTYVASSNSGVITVPTVPGSTGVLCKPFYVTAASWKYTSNSPWPQVIDQVDHVNTPSGTTNAPISASGTYAFAATITCGQGDVYASFSATEPVLAPENDALPGVAYLTAPSVPLVEHFLANMGFSGPKPTYSNSESTSCWSPTVKTGSAATTNVLCAAGVVAGSNTVSLEAVAGGKWTITSADYSHTYPVGFGGDATPTPLAYETYTISLTDGDAHDGITITPYSRNWTPTDASTLACGTSVTPTAPTFGAINTCGTTGSITIPTTVGIQYSLDGSPVAAGTVTGLTGSHTVGAASTTGYYIPGGTTTEWTQTLGTETPCLITVTPGDPTSSDQTCTPGAPPIYTGGSVTTDGNPNLTYTLISPDGVTSVVVPSLPATPTVTGLAPGNYTVNIVANTGYVLSGTQTFAIPVPITIAAATAACAGTPVTPVVDFTDASCVAPAADQPAAVAATENQGTITIPSNPQFTFTINGVPASVGPHPEADGSYVVVATLTPAAIAAGFTLGTNGVYTVNAAGNVATWPAVVLTSFCPPTLPVWHYAASGTPAVCTTTGALGTISLDHFTSTNPALDETGKVTYTLVNNTTHHVTPLGSTATSIKVAPGSYTVQATPTNPADGLTPNTGTVNEVDIAITIAAAATICGDDTTLAFTGGTIAWLGFVLAGGMLFLGAAFLIMRRRGNRTAQ